MATSTEEDRASRISDLVVREHDPGEAARIAEDEAARAQEMYETRQAVNRLGRYILS